MQINQAGSQKADVGKKDEFMQYSIAHDLKEPVRMVHIYTQLLEKKLVKQGCLDEEAQDYMRFVQEGAQRLNRMIDGMINLSESAHSPEAVQAIDMADVLYFVSNNLKWKIEESKADIRIIGKVPEVAMRYSHAVRILQNLIANSIKFRAKDRKPIIRLSAHKEGASVVFTLEDNGIGIPIHAQDRIFKPFQHGLSGQTDMEGSGIGLAICKKLIEEYAGTIWFDSTEDQGTSFSFKLPIAEKELF